MSGLDRAIRERLESDRYAGTPGTISDHADQYDSAICAVLDLVRDSRDAAKTDGLGLLCDWEIEQAVARALHVEASAEGGAT